MNVLTSKNLWDYSVILLCEYRMDCQGEKQIGTQTRTYLLARNGLSNRSPNRIRDMDWTMPIITSVIPAMQ